MDNRLEQLGEILMSYKQDILRIMKKYYSEMSDNITELEDMDALTREFDQKAKELDMRYEQIYMLRKALMKIDELYRELMFVEDVIKKMKEE